MEQTKPIAIMGFGNPVREDDGVGMYIIEKLEKALSDRGDVDVYDMGTSAFEVLFKLKNRKKVIFVDAVMNSGEPVGTNFKLPAEAIDAQIQDDPMVFLHSLKWDQALSYAKKMLVDEYPKDIDVYLVAIDSIKFNVGMTQAAIDGGDKMTEKILADIEKIPVACS